MSLVLDKRECGALSFYSSLLSRDVRIVQFLTNLSDENNHWPDESDFVPDSGPGFSFVSPA